MIERKTVSYDIIVSTRMSRRLRYWSHLQRFNSQRKAKIFKCRKGCVKRLSIWSSLSLVLSKILIKEHPEQSPFHSFYHGDLTFINMQNGHLQNLKKKFHGVSNSNQLGNFLYNLHLLWPDFVAKCINDCCPWILQLQWNHVHFIARQNSLAADTAATTASAGSATWLILSSLLFSKPHGKRN